MILSQVNNPSLQVLGLQLEAMVSNHLSQVVSIENLTAQNPWSMNQFADSMTNGVVLKDQESIVGFAVLALVAEQAELHNLAIHPQWQGRGVGTIFLNSLIQALPSACKMLYLEVSVTNYRAIRLYMQQGFEKIAERQGYYRTQMGTEDALIMSKALYSNNE